MQDGVFYIDPVAFQIGPLAIRWYALAYIAGLVIGWRLLIRMAAAPGSAFSPKQADDALLWVTAGVILGGRLGYVLFYRPDLLLQPLEAIALWKGGMSFHGGLLGVVIAGIWFCRREGIPMLRFADQLSCVVPIGLFFGRLANFVNGELWGRPTDVAWALVFHSDPARLPRHPSQLYEAALEGALLLALLWALRGTKAAARPGFLTGVFVAGYGVGRITAEFFREPDAHLGFLFAGATMGQLLSLPLVLVGLGLVWWSRRSDAPR